MAESGENISSPLRDCLIDNIQIGRQIGRGANGRILEAKWEGIVVAVKEIHSIFMNEVSDIDFQSFKGKFLRECEQSSRLRHPNIVRFLGIYNPSGAKVPSLVMERLHCDLTSLLQENSSIPLGIKLSIIHEVALGLRYLHTRNPSIIHRDLSSNNVLLSKGMEGKIGDLGTARLVDSQRKSKITKAPGTVDFMPPEALEDVANVFYGKELDVFSFGCVMLHTLSHQWPTPSLAVIINPETGIVTGGRSEVERRSKYFERIVGSGSISMIPLIESCLSNLSKNRPSIVKVCDQLEGRKVDRERISINESTMSTLQQELQGKEIELQKKDSEIKKKNAEIESLTTALQVKERNLEILKSKLSKSNLQIATPNPPPKQLQV